MQAGDLKEIRALPTAALREKYREVIGLEVRTNNRAYLLRRIAHVLQERAEAHLAASESVAPIDSGKPQQQDEGLDSRLPPPGSLLERQYEARLVQVKVLADGFEFEGRRYRSLSAIAREVTGTIWNGMLFFNLARRKPWTGVRQKRKR